MYKNFEMAKFVEEVYNIIDRLEKRCGLGNSDVYNVSVAISDKVIMVGLKYKGHHFFGHAICNPVDTFHYGIGLNIATARALRAAAAVDWMKI